MRSALRVLLIIAAAGFVTGAAAHEIAPAMVTINTAPPRYEITAAVNMEALLAGIKPEHVDTDIAPNARGYALLRALPPDALRARIDEFLPRWLESIELQFDRVPASPRIAHIDVPPTGETAFPRITTIIMQGEIPEGTRALRWRYGAAFGTSVLRVRRAGEPELVTQWLKEGDASAAVPLAGSTRKGMLEIFAEYLALGVTHTVPHGLDHILFVLGLYLLSAHWRPLLLQVTAFTLAHSITLALGLYGVVNLSPRIVEPLIALSIAYVAIENVATGRLHAWRPVVVFGFGLLHGLGFAEVLQEIGLPRADYVTGLVGFNLGVEIGQLIVIASAFLATGLWFRARPWYRSRIVVPASLAIAVIGLYWTLERILEA